MTKLELAEMLERFVGDKPDCGNWEWDDFTSTKCEPELEDYRSRLAVIDPPSGIEEIREIIAELRAHA